MKSIYLATVAAIAEASKTKMYDDEEIYYEGPYQDPYQDPYAVYGGVPDHAHHGHGHHEYAEPYAQDPYYGDYAYEEPEPYNHYYEER